MVDREEPWLEALPIVLAGGLEVGRRQVWAGPCEACGALTDLCSTGAPEIPIAPLCRDCLWEAVGSEALGLLAG